MQKLHLYPTRDVGPSQGGTRGAPSKREEVTFVQRPAQAACGSGGRATQEATCYLAVSGSHGSLHGLAGRVAGDARGRLPQPLPAASPAGPAQGHLRGTHWWRGWQQQDAGLTPPASEEGGCSLWAPHAPRGWHPAWPSPVPSDAIFLLPLQGRTRSLAPVVESDSLPQPAPTPSQGDSRMSSGAGGGLLPAEPPSQGWRPVLGPLVRGTPNTPGPQGDSPRLPLKLVPATFDSRDKRPPA